MQYLNTEAVSAMTGVHAVTLKSWRRAGLITAPESASCGYSWSQYIRICHIQLLVSRGDTLREIYNLINAPLAYRPSGWTFRRQEMLAILTSGNTGQLTRCIRQLGNDYSSDDYVNLLLRPIGQWLQSDNEPETRVNRQRFRLAVISQARRMMQASARQNRIPLFLEVISQHDETEIWLECIRLTGQGFRVELAIPLMDIPAQPRKRYEHHLMWCGNGLSGISKGAFYRRLHAGEPVMLCGPDKGERPEAVTCAG